MATGVYTRTEAYRAKMSASMTGHSVSGETRRKISNSITGKLQPWNKGAKSHMWKGEHVSYSGIHKWVNHWLGKPNKCQSCGKIGYGHSMHWANISKEYLRDFSDWIRLCVSCHKKYDLQKTI